MQLLFKEIMHFELEDNSNGKVIIESRISKDEYIEGFEKLQQHILEGTFMRSTIAKSFSQKCGLKPILFIKNYIVFQSLLLQPIIDVKIST